MRGNLFSNTKPSSIYFPDRDKNQEPEQEMNQPIILVTLKPEKGVYTEAGQCFNPLVIRRV